MRRSRTIVAHGVQWKLPVFIVLAAIGILGVGLWLTNATPGSAEFAAREMARPTSGIQSAVADLADLEPGAKMLVGAFAAQPSFSSAGNGQPELIPDEWEAPLFDILLDEKQDMNQRNARLLELATGAAKGVPSVQEECLMHLLFGLADDDGARFLAVATNSAIPAPMRAEFLREALAMRPTELGEWLSQQITNHYEPEVSSVARLYLLDRKGD